VVVEALDLDEAMDGWLPFTTLYRAPWARPMYIRVSVRAGARVSLRLNFGRCGMDVDRTRPAAECGRQEQDDGERRTGAGVDNAKY
jgi:hypothetical protein